MGIRVTIPKTKTPEAMKLASHIASYLFEQQCQELKYMKASEIETLKKAGRMLQRVSARTAKS